MDAGCFELTAAGRLAQVDAEDAMKRWRSGDGVFWLDLREHSPAELEALLAELPIGDLFRQRLLRVGHSHSTGVVTLRDLTLAEWTLFPDEACRRREYMAALCLENFLLTFPSGPVEGPLAVEQSLELSELGPLSPASVLCSLLLAHGARTAREARALRASLLELDQRMDGDPEDVQADELAVLKQDLLRAESIGEEQDEIFRLLSELKLGPLDFSDVRGPMGIATSTAVATRRLSERLEGRFLDLRHRVSEHKQDLLNRRLAFLTVISTIFLPLTLLAGIWGMNFDSMPELKTPYGYPIALGSMLLVAAGVAAFLRKRNWFD